MTASDLFANVPEVRLSGDAAAPIHGISIDSRKVVPGDLFVALSGEKVDGNDFIEEAVGKGAVAVASDPKAREWLGGVSSRVYGDPSQKMTVVGITGTNGKTTIAHLVETILSRAGRNPAYIGTVGYRWNGTTHPALHTTPEAPELHAMLSKMNDEKVTDVVIECSSHGLELGRLGGLALDVALFTNLTQDHLDFHSSWGAYRETKKKLFSELLTQSTKPKRKAILNLDDPVGEAWSSEITLPVVTFSIHPLKKADIHAVRYELNEEGIEATISIRGQETSLQSPLVGEFNLSNLLAAIAIADSLGIFAQEISSALTSFEAVPGRLERVSNERGVDVFVDYAHTEDALSNVLQALRPLRKKRLIVVFGCGGDRDRGKRPKMAAVAAEYADLLIVTSDNPRTENPDSIICEILEGIPNKRRETVRSMAERRAAIEQALSISEPGDMVLIAGKGHETYQEVNGIRHPFDDREVAASWFGGSQ